MNRQKQKGHINKSYTIMTKNNTVKVVDKGETLETRIL